MYLIETFCSDTTSMLTTRVKLLLCLRSLQFGIQVSPRPPRTISVQGLVGGNWIGPAGSLDGGWVSPTPSGTGDVRLKSWLSDVGEGRADPLGDTVLRRGGGGAGPTRCGGPEPVVPRETTVLSAWVARLSDRGPDAAEGGGGGCGGPRGEGVRRSLKRRRRRRSFR